MVASAPRSVTCLLVFLLLSSCGTVHADDPLIGTKPPAWRVSNWLNSEPLALKDLSGKVVLIRWWTAPGCALCEATAPALNEFHVKYQDKGLVVLGFYHHKVRTPLDVEQVKRSAQKLGFRFPVAIDPNWQTLKSWWLDRGERRFTSVIFLIDRKGVIRHIHPGGVYVPGDRDYAVLKAKIEALLQEE